MAITPHPLRVAMAQAGYKSTTELAARSKVSRRTCNEILGSGHVPSHKTLALLAFAVNMDTADLASQLITYAEQQEQAA